MPRQQKQEQSREHCGREPGRAISWLLGRQRGELLGFGLELPLGPLWRVLGVGEPGGVEELLVRAVVVADEPELLALPHPPQHDLHLPLARQSHKANILDMVPDVGDGERPVLPDDIEDCARDGLRLLRRRCQLDRRHLWLPLLRRPPHLECWLELVAAAAVRCRIQGAAVG